MFYPFSGPLCSLNLRVIISHVGQSKRGSSRYSRPGPVGGTVERKKNTSITSVSEISVGY